MVPPPLRDGLYQAVRAAWVAGCRVREAHYPPLQAALEQMARAAYAGAVPVAEVLRALDVVCRPHLGRDPTLDWDHVREWAGRTVIAAYYRAD
jgi:hypothetical protein